MTWRVHSDRVFAIGGVRALILQALHPLTMAAVAQQRGFEEDFWGRLDRTGQYVSTLTYAPAPQAQRLAAQVRGIHRKLRGTDPDTGETFRLDRPDLLLWVHCCEVESFLTHGPPGRCADQRRRRRRLPPRAAAHRADGRHPRGHGADVGPGDDAVLRGCPARAATDRCRAAGRPGARRSADAEAGSAAHPGPAGLGGPGRDGLRAAAEMGAADVPVARSADHRPGGDRRDPRDRAPAWWCCPTAGSGRPRCGRPAPRSSCSRSRRDDRSAG